MTPKSWIKLNTAKLNKPHAESIRGVEVNVSVSPYDVPEAVRGAYDPEVKRFAIEFKYLAGEEPLSLKEQTEFVTLCTGKNSNRLYRIEIDVDGLGASQVTLKVLTDAIDSLSTLDSRPPRTGNYRLAKQVISERGSELLQLAK